MQIEHFLRWALPWLFGFHTPSHLVSIIFGWRIFSFSIVDAITLISVVRPDYRLANKPGKVHFLRERWKVVGWMGPEYWETAHVRCWLSLLTSCLIQQLHLPYEALETQNVYILWLPITLHLTFEFLSNSENKSCWLWASSQQMWVSTANSPGNIHQGRAWEPVSSIFPYCNSINHLTPAQRERVGDFLLSIFMCPGKGPAHSQRTLPYSSQQRWN